MGVSLEHVIDQPIEISRLEAMNSDACQANIDIVVGPIWAVTHFRIINALTSCHLLLWGPWFHIYHIYPTPLINAFKLSKLESYEHTTQDPDNKASIPTNLP